MQNLIVTVMGDNGSRFIDMCFNSILDADKIIFCWGEEDIETKNKYKEWKAKYPDKFEIISLKYNQMDKEQNGKTRNYYLNYLKQNYPNDWCLCIDLDEVVEDLSKIKAFIQEGVPGLYSIKMRHFQNDFGHEDATVPIHYVPNRLFKIDRAGEYPLGEHVVLQPKVFAVKRDEELPFTAMEQIQPTTIWHLAHINHCFNIKGRYEKNLKHSNIHNTQFLNQWYLAHLFGKYPSSEVEPTDIPDCILNNFGIDKDYFYFANRRLEMKHFVMYKQWSEYFRQMVKRNQSDPLCILDIGCGNGCYGAVAKQFLHDEYKGVELSNYAVKSNPYGLNIVQGNIINHEESDYYDVTFILDILEHLKYEELDLALSNVSKINSSFFLFSIPFRGDPNLMLDKTHIIKEFKDWWIEQLSKYFLIEEAPANWLFANQLLIGRRK